MKTKMSKGKVAKGNKGTKTSGGYPVNKPDGSGCKPVHSYPDAGNAEDARARGMQK